jgi:hypothetical protein
MILFLFTIQNIIIGKAKFIIFLQNNTYKKHDVIDPKNTLMSFLQNF